jgi:hypothetical protein
MTNGFQHLWSGVQLKLEHATFQFHQMSAAIQPPSGSVGYQHTGAIVGNLWETPFYAALDAFLSATRSVAEIIKCCFGQDRVLRTWLSGLPQDEQDRRKTFQQLYEPHYDVFKDLPLAQARHVSEHRTGYPSVTVEVSGVFGLTHKGGPTQSIPISEATCQPEDPSLPRRPTEHVPLRPSWNDFNIDGQPLFTACQTFLQAAGDLAEASRKIAQQVHGSHTITRPPL